MIDTTLAERITALPPLSCGNHDTPKDGMCMMEAAAHVAGLPFSDHPECVSRVIAPLLRVWNDDLPDVERDALLRPLISVILNTSGSEDLERRRGLMAGDWLIRENLPAWLRLAGLTTHADTLAGLPEITDEAQYYDILEAVSAARASAEHPPTISASAPAIAWAAATRAVMLAAGDAASAAASASPSEWRNVQHECLTTAGDAACDAAMIAASAAAALVPLCVADWDAAGATAEAAHGAPDAWAKAWFDARNAATAVARDAVNAALTPTIHALQQSAVRLVIRMADEKETDHE